MKKVVKILAFIMAVLMCIFAVVACSSDKDAEGANAMKPNTDPNKVKQALEGKEYMVTVVDDGTVLETLGVSGLSSVISAVSNDKKDALAVYYFKDSDSAKKSYDVLKAEAEKSKKTYGNVSVGIFGKMIWYGTETAIKAAK